MGMHYEMRFTSQAEETRFVQDCMAIVGDKTILLRDLIDSLRNGYFHGRLDHAKSDKGAGTWGTVRISNRWRGLSDEVVERTLYAYGFHFAGRRHGAGWAQYVAKRPFSTVVDRYGKTVEVR